jgi:hypothetical protein
MPQSNTQLISSWDQGAGYFDDTGKQLIMVKWQSKLQPDYHRCKVIAVDVGTGGVTTIRRDPVVAIAPCPGGFDGFTCQVKIALGDIFGAAEDVWSSKMRDVHDAAMTKLPFAYIILAYDGVSSQVTRASAAVVTSSTCAGFTMTLPSMPPSYYTGFAGPTSAPGWPSAVPMPSFAVLRCADLEPWGGTTWWQGIRTAMGASVYLLFAWTWFKRLQPKLSLNG